VPNKKGAKVLEVGSAPGKFLVEFKQNYDCVPYGLEYSETGVELNRKVFSSHGINPDNVICADFFSNEFHEQYRERFDIVISRGFIEHFADVDNVIQEHLNLLKPGGHLIVSIPNVRGANYILTQLFYKELIPIHNLNIMRKKEFSKLFNNGRLSHLFCDYYGTFSFGLFYTKNDGPMRLVLDVCSRLQRLLNLIFRLILQDKGAESRLFSPHLLFIGKKIE
jgi:2-polyprenyl-3-methyl-5-hydroxy-6-metoxy-1,4-benzoquinol methylase